MNLNRYKLALALALGLVSTACNDNLSTIGEIIQPGSDKVESRLHRLEFSSRTVRLDSIYSTSTAGLLGEISDPVYGDFKGEFIAQIRFAPGFKFPNKPENGQIDSVNLDLRYSNYVGDRNAPMKVTVYEVERGFAGLDFSQPNLDKYRKRGNLLSSDFVSLAKNTLYLRDTISILSLKLDKAIGQRIYDLSETKPQAFETQEAFSREVLGGLLLTTSTGSGCVVEASNLMMNIFYHFKKKDGKDSVSAVTFTNTRQTPQANGFTSSSLEELLAPNGQYSYIKSPAGLVTELTLSEEQLKKLLDGRAQVNIGTSWLLADAKMTFQVENPEGMRLNPSSYMMLMPRDSVSGFFRAGETERTQAAIAYLSTRYTIQSQQYTFANISRLIMEHLRLHAKYDAATKAWSVARPLILHLLPVSRRVDARGGNTISVSEQLTPTFVRLGKSAEKMKFDVISTEFKL